MDLMKMMRQAQDVQAKMQRLQQELDGVAVQGVAGAGAVTVTMSAKGDLRAVAIDAALLKPEDKEIVEDLILAAHADARRKAEAAMQEKMGQLTAGLNLPPGMSLPF